MRASTDEAAVAKFTGGLGLCYTVTIFSSLCHLQEGRIQRLRYVATDKCMGFNQTATNLVAEQPRWVSVEAASRVAGFRQD